MYTLPADRTTIWNPGLNSVGGIPNRTTIYQTFAAGTAMATIQAALDACPANQVVKLGAGDFSITGNGLTITRSNVTLRGTLDANGRPATRLIKPTGTNYPVIIIGARWPKWSAATNLSADGVKGSYSITLASNPGVVAGDIVNVNTVTNAALTNWELRTEVSTPTSSGRGWFTEMDRPIGQILEVASVAGNVITFNTPLHIDFPVADQAHIRRISTVTGGTAIPVANITKWSGIEDIYAAYGEGGDGGGSIHLFSCAYCWVKNVESTLSNGSSVNLDATFRCEVRDSYIHTTVNPNPGGAGYGISVNLYASDNLIENNAVWNFNKVIVMRASGGGNVVGYNYMEDGYGAGYKTIPEVGLNASHMTTAHMELFEGNQAWNFDSDIVWGNTIYITVFRNHLTGLRRNVGGLGLVDSSSRRCCSTQDDSWWFSFVGNVLGFPGMPTAPQTSWVYNKDGSASGNNAIAGVWSIGWGTAGNWSAPQDSLTLQRTIRDGNYDYFTNTVNWHGLGGSVQNTTPPADAVIPDSLYLSSKPAFFGTKAWPPVAPEYALSPLRAVLPAQERFNAAQGLSTWAVPAEVPPITKSDSLTESLTSSSGETIRLRLTASAFETSSASVADQISPIALLVLTPQDSASTSFPFTAVGVATKGATVRVYSIVNGALLGSAIADVTTGNWSIQINSL